MYIWLPPRLFEMDVFGCDAGLAELVVVLRGDHATRYYEDVAAALLAQEFDKPFVVTSHPTAENSRVNPPALLGLEPRQADSESAVLPLHHEAKKEG